MTGQLEVLITFILYIAFFAWVGYRRGSRSELIVFLTALGGWLLLQEQGDLFVRIVNLGSKGVAFVQAGGLGENPDDAFGALGDAAPWVTNSSRGGFLFVLWAVLLFLAYIVSSARFLGKKSKGDGWAILLGAFNGLLYAAILLPRLATLLTSADDVIASTPGANVGGASVTTFFGLLRGGFDLLRQNVGGVWRLFDTAQQSLILLVLLTLFLLLVASSLRGRSRSSRGSRGGSSGGPNTQGSRPPTGIDQGVSRQ